MAQATALQTKSTMLADKEIFSGNQFTVRIKSKYVMKNVDYYQFPIKSRAIFVP